MNNMKKMTFPNMLSLKVGSISIGSSAIYLPQTPCVLVAFTLRNAVETNHILTS